MAERGRAGGYCTPRRDCGDFINFCTTAARRTFRSEQRENGANLDPDKQPNKEIVIIVFVPGLFLRCSGSSLETIPLIPLSPPTPRVATPIFIRLLCGNVGYDRFFFFRFLSVYLQDVVLTTC